MCNLRAPLRRRSLDLQPERDGALENDIVSHEATHGITNRMTGGGTASCLQATEAAGMGEGWSDAMADWLENDFKIDDFIMGASVISILRTRTASSERQGST